MRRKDREITDKSEIEAVLKAAEVCRLGLCENNIPYVVPLNYGYEDGCLYMHCAKEGKKLEMIRKNNQVCFEVDVNHELVKGEQACDWTYKFKSVIGSGKATIIDDYEEKIKGLEVLMKHFSGMSGHQYMEKYVNAIYIIKVEIGEMTGKQLG